MTVGLRARVSFFVLVSALAAACANTPAVTPGSSEARDPELATPKTDGSLTPMAWLEGRWVSDGGKFEETWTSSASVMVGVSFTTRGEKTAGWEVMAIEADDATNALRYSAMVDGAPPVAFAAREVAGTRAVFTNPARAFPKSVTYAREGNGLTARIEGDDAAKALTFAWKSAPRAPAKTLEEAERLFDEDVARRGTEGWVDAFDDQGAMLHDDGRAEGHDAVRAAIAPLFASGTTLRWAATASGFAPSHDLGFTVGRYVSRSPAKNATDGGAPRVGHGTYVTVWSVAKNGRPRVLFDTGFPDAKKASR